MATLTGRMFERERKMEEKQRKNSQAPAYAYISQDTRIPKKKDKEPYYYRITEPTLTGRMFERERKMEETQKKKGKGRKTRRRKQSRSLKK